MFRNHEDEGLPAPHTHNLDTSDIRGGAWLTMECNHGNHNICNDSRDKNDITETVAFAKIFFEVTEFSSLTI